MKTLKNVDVNTTTHMLILFSVGLVLSLIFVAGMIGLTFLAQHLL
jgi:hypothetical protein